MGAILPSKMPSGKRKQRRDNTDFTEYAEGGEVKSKVNEAGNYTQPGMRKSLFNKIKGQATQGTAAGQWSARKAQLLAKQYKSKGGIIAPHHFSVSAWWDLAQKYQATWINMVPTIIAYLINVAKSTGKKPTREDLKLIRFGRSASAPLPPEQHKEFEALFGITVIEAMGMTESSSMVFCNPHDERRRYGSPGLPCGVEAKVIDPSGLVLGDQTVGEICLRGNNVMSAYYKGEAETQKAFGGDAWLKTGDLGMRDTDGFYFITGRLKELIIKGGENIAPREIDEALLKHPAVLDAAAVGIPDANYGQEIMACIILKDNVSCSEVEMRDFCIKTLGKFRTPKVIKFVRDLPRGASGKVQRLKLLDLIDA
jgi:long-chain acyl-CoA synthetase